MNFRMAFAGLTCLLIHFPTVVTGLFAAAAAAVTLGATVTLEATGALPTVTLEATGDGDATTGSGAGAS